MFIVSVKRAATTPFPRSPCIPGAPKAIARRRPDRPDPTRLSPVQSDGRDQIGRPRVVEEEVPRAQAPERRGASLQKKEGGLGVSPAP